MELREVIMTIMLKCKQQCQVTLHLNEITPKCANIYNNKQKLQLNKITHTG